MTATYIRRRSSSRPSASWVLLPWGTGLFEARQEDHVELQALGRMHGHQLDGLGAGVGLVVAGLQRGVGEELGQHAAGLRGRPPGRAGAHLGAEVGGGVEEFVEVLEALLAFLFELVVGAQAGHLDDVVHHFVEGRSG